MVILSQWGMALALMLKQKWGLILTIQHFIIILMVLLQVTTFLGLKMAGSVLCMEVREQRQMLNGFLDRIFV